MVRVGVVGFGLAGRVFHAPLISSVDGLELAGIVERSGGLAAQRYPGVTIYRSLEEMLADDSIELLVIATPSGTHFELAQLAIEAGRHVIVDKPVATCPNEIAHLIRSAKSRGVKLIPFHNRRWDGDYLTLAKLVKEGTLGRLVHLESRMDRWNPGAARKPWKNDAALGGGVLLDLGTHLADQALTLFGKPEAVWGDVLRERDGEGADDAFTVLLRYADGLRVTLGANALSSPAGARFHLRGTRGNYRKKGIDPQEAALGKVTRIGDAHWGEEPREEWGMLHVDVDGGRVTRPLETTPGDYRKFYEGVRDALAGSAEQPVTPQEAWRVASVLEWAAESSASRCEVACDWSGEPE
jgi:predicted dehydrogenase